MVIIADIDPQLSGSAAFSGFEHGDAGGVGLDDPRLFEI